MDQALVVAVRGIIAFTSLLIFARVLGKQQISQLTFFEYVLGITIGSMAASLTTDLRTPAWPHWVGLLTWVLAALAVQWVTLKWRYAAKYIDGEPTVVIMNGQVMEKALRTLRYRLSDLLELLRTKGVFDLSEVEFAVLEANGSLSVLRKSQHQPVTPKDLNLPTTYKGVSTELVYDGVVVDQNLEQVGLDRSWLEAELRKQGIQSPEEVFAATLETSGKLYVDRYRDRVKRLVDVSDFKGPS